MQIMLWNVCLIPEKFGIFVHGTQAACGSDMIEAPHALRMLFFKLGFEVILA
jgi:hypothetical protein